MSLQLGCSIRSHGSLLCDVCNGLQRVLKTEQRLTAEFLQSNAGGVVMVSSRSSCRMTHGDQLDERETTQMLRYRTGSPWFCRKMGPGSFDSLFKTPPGVC